jgi:hypothetical protein
MAIGEELEGQIRNSGSGANQQVELVGNQGKTAQKLCGDDGATRVKRLTGMTLKVTGEWKLNKAGERQCLALTGFTIVKHTSGRSPLVGVLQNENGVYVVAGEDGKKKVLGEVSSGLKKLAGKRVILDVKPLDASTDKSAVLKVVTYGEYPD